MLHPGWGSGDGVAPLDDFYLNFFHVWRIVLMNEFCSCMEDCVGFCWRICNLGLKLRARPGAGLGGGGRVFGARPYLRRRTTVPHGKIDDLHRCLGTGGRYVCLQKIVLTACKKCLSSSAMSNSSNHFRIAEQVKST